MATLKDLRKWKQEDQVLDNGVTILARQPKLFCQECGETYSANPADYFVTKEREVFKCCGDEPMILVYERTIMVPVEKDREFDDLMEAFTNN